MKSNNDRRIVATNDNINTSVLYGYIERLVHGFCASSSGRSVSRLAASRGRYEEAAKANRAFHHTGYILASTFPYPIKLVLSCAEIRSVVTLLNTPQETRNLKRKALILVTEFFHYDMYVSKAVIID